MKNNRIVLTMVITFLLLILQGCVGLTQQTSDIENTLFGIVSDNVSELEPIETENGELDEYTRIALFQSFIDGSIPYYRDGQAYYFGDEVVDEEGVFYAIYDLNCDGKVELSIKTPRSFYSLYEKGEMLHLMYCGSGYDDLLNDGTVLAEMHLGASDHYVYIHTAFNQDGGYEKHTYEKYDMNHDLVYDEDDSYFIDSEPVTLEVFGLNMEAILSIGKDKIDWQQ